MLVASPAVLIERVGFAHASREPGVDRLGEHLRVRARVVHAGLRLDIHALAESTSLLGGDEGTLGVGPAHDSRLGVVSLANEDLLVVIVQAPPAELHASWTMVAPILESVDLDEG